MNEVSILRHLRCTRREIRSAGTRAGLAAIAALVLVVLAGCGGGSESGGVEPPPPPVIIRPPVEMVTLDLEGRDPYDGQAGTGYAHVCPGADDRIGPRSFLIRISGFDPGRVDAMPAPGELEDTCNSHAPSSNYHLVETRWINGADYIQRNAGVVRALIETMTADYEINAGDRFAIVGESMGGVVSRYALQQMETEGVAHNVDLFVSVDSPQQGAYVPIGTQHLADLFRNDGGQATLDELDTPAAKQMLIYHYSRGGDAQSWHDLYGALYRDELDGMLGGFLRDPGIRTVGVSSGRIGGNFEAPLPGQPYYAGRLTFRETVPFSYPFNQFPCATTFKFNVKVEVLVEAQALSLFLAGPGAGGAYSKVASRDIRAEIDDIRLGNTSGLIDHFTDLVIDQLPGACRTVAAVLTAVVADVVKPIAAAAVDEAEDALNDATSDYFSTSIFAPISEIVGEGAPGGTSDAIGKMRDTFSAAGFVALPLDPGVAAKDTNMFIPFASALMLDGIWFADTNMTDEMVRAASAFDEVYFETDANRAHLKSSTNWFEQEVLALFDAP